MAELLKGFRLNPRVKWRWEGKDKILLNTMIGMNRTAGEILELCEKTHTLNDITEEMSRRYPKTPKEKIKSDTEKWISKLLKWNILIPKDSTEYAVPSSALALHHVILYFRSKLSAPVRVACELTFACDARCLHCFAASPRPHPNELTTAEWQSVFDELRKLGVFGVSFTGGEPFMRPDLAELVRYASDKGLSVTVTTNGATLDSQKVSSLVSGGLVGMYISLDGACAETHDKFRGHDGLFEKVVSAIPTLLAEKGLDVAVLTTISKINIREITEIMEFVDKMNVRRLALMNLVKAGRGADSSLHPSHHEYIELISKVHQKERELRATHILYPNLPAAYFEKSIGLQEYRQLKENGKIAPCGAGILTCSISPTGDVKPCDVSGDVSLGNVRKQPLKRIWDASEVFVHLRDITKKKQAPCGECKLNDLCIAGCNALENQIDKEAADPICFDCFTSMFT